MRYFTNSPSGLVTAAGDLLQGSSAGILERLAVGSAGQRLSPISGKEAWVTPGSQGVTHANPTGTTSNTYKMAGLGDTWTFTPNFSGRVLVIVNGVFTNTLINDGVSTYIAYGTGAAPANGAAATGTAAGQTQDWLAYVANARSPFCLAAVLTGLAVGTQYWIDLGVEAVTAGTASIATPNLSVVEF